MNRDHGCDSGNQDREDQRWLDEERDHFEAESYGQSYHEEQVVPAHDDVPLNAADLYGP